MKSTKEKILDTLLIRPNSSIQDMAAAIGINGISVRHHLINLEADGLVESEQRRNGVGRPKFIYRLTLKGVEKFPTNYLRLLDHLMGAMKDLGKDGDLDVIFTRIGHSLASRIKLNADAANLDDQLQELSCQLSPDGFKLSWETDGDRVMLHNHSCPYYQIGMNYPEICEIDRVLFSTTLKRELTHEACILTGDQQCTYIIKV